MNSFYSTKWENIFLLYINNSTTNEISKIFLTVVHIIIHNVGNNGDIQSTFPIKLYQPEEDPTVGQLSDKDVQCFLCLAVSTLNSEKETNSSFFRKNKNRSSRPEVFCKKGVLRNFAKFTEKHLCRSLFLSIVAGLRSAILFKKETLAQVFSCEFCEIAENTFSYRKPPVAA